MTRFLAVGGDMRNVYLARELVRRGCDVSVWGIGEDIANSFSVPVCKHPPQALATVHTLLLPLPCTHNGITVNTPLFNGCIYLNDIYTHISKNAVICGGRLVNTQFEKYGLKAYDYCDRDDFACLNAIPTAEGAIEAVMKELCTTIRDSRTLVCGFGRTASVLALTLKAMGAQVTVCARSLKARSEALSYGMDAIDMGDLVRKVSESDAIFNTIPHLIFTKDILASVPPHVPLADLASAPGCANKEEAEQMNVKYMFLPGLPGKYAPETAGKIILKTVENIVTECGKEADLWIYDKKESALP